MIGKPLKFMTLQELNEKKNYDTKLKNKERASLHTKSTYIMQLVDK